MVVCDVVGKGYGIWLELDLRLVWNGFSFRRKMEDGMEVEMG